MQRRQNFQVRVCKGPVPRADLLSDVARSHFLKKAKKGSADKRRRRWGMLFFMRIDHWQRLVHRCYSRKRSGTINSREEKTEEQREREREKPPRAKTLQRSGVIRQQAGTIGRCHRDYILLSFVKSHYTQMEITESLYQKLKLVAQEKPIHASL